MARFTLHMDCLTALEQERPEAALIRALGAALNAGKADVSIAALATVETDFQQFRARLASHGLGQIEILRPMHYFDISFAEWCVFPTEELEDIEREIHSILYPSIHYAWKDFRKAQDLEETTPSRDVPWRQAKCDVQSILAHMEDERDVFVTSAEIFHREIKKRQLIALGARAIATPDEAVGMI